MSLPDLPPPTGAPTVPVAPAAPVATGRVEGVAPGASPTPPGGTGQWQRQSPRMLIVHPLRLLSSFAVPLVLAVAFGRNSDSGLWWLIGPAVVAVLVVVGGVLSWFVTRYRFTDEQLQLRTGLLNRRLLTAPLDRVRSVDVESSPVHRVLGLAKVKVGTGVDSSRIELDGVSKAQALELRSFLLGRATAEPQAEGRGAETESGTAAPVPPGESGAAAQVGIPSEGGATSPAGADVELARIDWSWLRFAPFSLSSLVVVAGLIGVLSQFGDDLPVSEIELAQEAWQWVVAQAVLILVAVALLVVVIGWVLLSTLTYVITWWNLRVVREARGNLRITRGLLTTHSQTVEQEKVRGARMGEPFLLRLVRGAELSAIATGVGTGGIVRVLPPAPRSVATVVGHDLLEETGALTMPLTGHGPFARRRIHLRHQWGTLILVALLAVPTYLLDLWWFDRLPEWGPPALLLGLGPVNAVVAESAWRNLGHALTERHLVVQTGAFVRTREVLEVAGVIGWVVTQTFFQRRRGLCNLVATTAAGAEQVTAPDIPVEAAVALARAATPGMLDDLQASYVT